MFTSHDRNSVWLTAKRKWGGDFDLPSSWYAIASAFCDTKSSQPSERSSASRMDSESGRWSSHVHNALFDLRLWETLLGRHCAARLVWMLRKYRSREFNHVSNSVSTSPSCRTLPADSQWWIRWVLEPRKPPEEMIYSEHIVYMYFGWGETFPGGMSEASLGEREEDYHQGVKTTIVANMWLYFLKKILGTDRLNHSSMFHFYSFIFLFFIFLVSMIISAPSPQNSSTNSPRNFNHPNFQISSISATGACVWENPPPPRNTCWWFQDYLSRDYYTRKVFPKKIPSQPKLKKKKKTLWPVHFWKPLDCELIYLLYRA